MGLITLVLGLMHTLLGLAIFLISLAVVIYCIIDCSQRRFLNPNHKVLWIAALVVTLLMGVGWLTAMLYLMIGREQGRRY